MEWEWQAADPAVRALLNAAALARQRAYAPYSGYQVGAAVLTPDGVVVTGCNIENASYGLSLCAERVAIGSAIADGLLPGLGGASTHWPAPSTTLDGGLRALAIVTAGPLPVTPCGACRQVLAEFAAEDCPVWCATLDGLVHAYTLGELLPAAFGL
jgi:homotetrameric cytidine deaminase